MRSFTIGIVLLLSATAQAQVCSIQMTCPPPSLLATYQDSATDKVGAGVCATQPDGIPDTHFTLNNLVGAPATLTIAGNGPSGGIWKWPCAGASLPLVQYNGNGTADVWYAFWQPNASYTVTVTYANGMTQTTTLTGAP